MRRLRKHQLMAAFYQTSKEIGRQWGSPIGLPLVTRFYSDEPWISAAELAEGLEISEDTVRRGLERLMRIGRVNTIKSGRTYLYQAHPAWAERTLTSVKTFVSNAKCE